MTLPAAQRTALVFLQEIDGILLSDDPVRIRAQTVEALLRRGYIEKVTAQDGEHLYITDAGRKAMPWRRP